MDVYVHIYICAYVNICVSIYPKGLHADSAEDGQKAVELISEDLEAYKVIFMDNVMPVMNGMEATRAIRKAGYRYLIVAVTGNIKFFSFLLVQYKSPNRGQLSLRGS
jgi:DNA-binding LytR/AlgR family response regulator